MKCPFCEREMKKGIVEADYCEACKKMNLDPISLRKNELKVDHRSTCKAYL